jgi:hypothetical protein
VCIARTSESKTPLAPVDLLASAQLPSQVLEYSVRTQLTFVSPEPNPDRATRGLGISSGPTSKTT